MYGDASQKWPVLAVQLILERLEKDEVEEVRKGKL